MPSQICDPFSRYFFYQFVFARGHLFIALTPLRLRFFFADLLLTGNPLDQPLPLNSDFWDKKSQYYSHGGSSDDEASQEVVVQRLQDPDERAQRLEAQLELIAPVVDQAQRKWAGLADDLDHLNFTAIEWEIENELPEPNDRTWRKGRQRGRGARGLPAFLGNAVKLFDLKQVVKELETSVMTSVSCSACKAGTIT